MRKKYTEIRTAHMRASFARIAYMQNAWRRVKNRVQDVMGNEEGMGTVEVILIILVLVGLVIIFKTQLTNLVDSIFEKIVKQAGSI